MSHYQHLTIEERESIWEFSLRGESLRQIARETGRSASTISRELARNRTAQGYRPSAAQAAYQKRRRRCRRPRVLAGSELGATVARLISQLQCSPEQIANRLALENGKPLVSCHTIYRALRCGCMEPKGSHKNSQGKYPMQKNLRQKARKNRGESRRKPQSYIHQTIDERPKAAEDRKQLGHWEGDLVYSSFHKVYIVTMVERASRFVITSVCKTKQPEEIAAVIVGMLKGLPREKLRTITFDRGIEFSQHHLITAVTGAQVYFAHPRAPWERGTNENTNGLLRQYVPKHTYKVPFSEELLRQFTRKLNYRPRKCLGWRTPLECFSGKVLHLT